MSYHTAYTYKKNIDPYDDQIKVQKINGDQEKTKTVASNNNFSITYFNNKAGTFNVIFSIHIVYITA